MATPFVQGDWAFSRTVTLQAAQIDHAMPDGGESGYPVPVMIAPGAANDPTDFADTFAFINDPTKDVCLTADPPGANILPHLWRSPELFEDVGDPRLHGIVLVPSYSAVADTTIIQWERDDGAVDLQQASEVFKTADGFGLSMGLEENPPGVGNPGAYSDDTGVNDGDDEVWETGEDGVLGRGQKLDGLNDYILVSYASPAVFTYSIWAQRTGNGVRYARLHSSDDSPNWTLELAVRDTDEVVVLLQFTDGTNSGWRAVLSPFGNDVWRQVVATWDADYLRVYVDGSEEYASNTWSGKTAAQNQSVVGCAGDEAFEGFLDEAVMRNAISSANRVSEDHNWIDNNVARLGFSARGAVGIAVVPPLHLSNLQRQSVHVVDLRRQGVRLDELGRKTIHADLD